MTKKDYERAALIVKAAFMKHDRQWSRSTLETSHDALEESTARAGLYDMMEAFVTFFRGDPRFDVEWFRAACGGRRIGGRP